MEVSYFVPVLNPGLSRVSCGMLVSNRGSAEASYHVPVLNPGSLAAAYGSKCGCDGARVKMFALSMKNKQIAEKLFISYHTVRNHRVNIFKKLNANGKHHAVRIAQERGWM